MTPLRAVLDASGSFTSFATEYVRRNAAITECFEIQAQRDPVILAAFKAVGAP